MSSLENILTEIKEQIFRHFDDPRDLLHVALTCKSFYEMIIPTHQLDLTSISCCDSKTPLKFWRILGALRHYASMIRQLELCDQPTFDYLVPWRGQFRGRRMDEGFVEALGWDSLSVSADLGPQELFFRSLADMDGLKSISRLTMTEEDFVEEYDCLFHMSKNFSHSLEVLHLYYGEMGLPFDPIPQYKSSDFSFHRLTSFSLDLYAPVQLGDPFDLLLNGLASNCPNLVNFALQLFGSFPIVHLIKKATWPSLKKLTLAGCLQFTDNGASHEDNVDSYHSFFGRHTQLERLCISLIHEPGSHFIENLIQHLSPVLPSLQSLRCDCPIPPDILSRLLHATNMFKSVNHYFHCWAGSLRSCIINSIRFDRLEALIKAMPELERLSLTIELPDEEDNGEYEIFFKELPEILSLLDRLTHLEISETLGVVRCHPKDFIPYLGHLTYFRHNTEMMDSGWQRITFDDSSSPITYRYSSLENSPDQSFRSEFWGGFFTGPVMQTVY